MDAIDYELSSQQAAHLLRVHESSVKRWCNADKLACRTTQGGHRRISLDALLAMAGQEALSCRLLDLRPYEKEVWRGLSQVWAEERYAVLVDLLFEWLKGGDRRRSEALLLFVQEMGIALSVVFDRVVAPVLHRIGEGWQAGALRVGDEHRMTERLRDTLYALLLGMEEPEGSNAWNNKVAVVGCGRTETHDLGALMVRLLLTASGWRVVYLGGRVPVEDLAAQQAEYSASLVCVSFAPPPSQPDSLNLVDLLARLYREDQPYRLALGGGGLEGGLTLAASTSPFLDLRCFEDTSSFVAWLSSLRA